MRRTILKISFTILVIITFVILTSFKIGPVRIGGWVGDKLDKVSGLAGIPGEMLTAGAINNMHNKLNENIDHLDAALSKNAKTAIGNLDSVLTAREDQFDSIMTKNINQFNEGITQNIAKLDQTFQNAISGIRYLGVDIGKMVWDTTKMLAQFVILAITVYFIFLTYNRYRKSDGFDRQMIKDLFRQVWFYLLMWVLCIVLIVLYRPLLSNFSNTSYEQELQGYRASLRSAIKSNNYESAYLTAGSLKIATGGIGEATYGFNKIALIRQLFYLTKEQQEKEPSISQNFMTLESNYYDFKITDPEFYIVSALFKKNFYASKEGLLLAAIDCIHYINSKKKGENKVYSLSLSPFAKDILNLYFLNPYDSISIHKILEKNNEKVDDEILNVLNSGNFDSKNIMSTPVVDFKAGVIETIRNDQDAFFTFLTSNKELAKIDILKRWREIVNNISKGMDEKYFANKSMIYNDFIAQNILAESRDSILNDIDNIDSQIKSDTSLKFLSETKLFYFKKKLIANVLKNTNEPYARAVKTKWAIQETDFYYNKIDSLTAFDSELNNSHNKAIAILNLENCVRLACELNLYYRQSKSLRRPLAYFYMDFGNSILKNTKEDELVKAHLNSLAQSTLEKNYYDF